MVPRCLLLMLFAYMAAQEGWTIPSEIPESRKAGRSRVQVQAPP